MNLSTLRRYVRALGEELQVTARFPDGAVEIGTEPKPRKHASPLLKEQSPGRILPMAPLQRISMCVAATWQQDLADRVHTARR
jgi:hypothetical protein